MLLLQAPTSSIKSMGQCVTMRGGRSGSVTLGGRSPQATWRGVAGEAGGVVGKVRVESGNSLETFALAKVSRSLPVVKPAISIPIWQGVPRQGWSRALP